MMHLIDLFAKRAPGELDVTGTDRSAAETVDELRVSSRCLELSRPQSAGRTRRARHPV